MNFFLLKDPSTLHRALHDIRGAWLKTWSASKMPMWNQYNSLIYYNGLWQVTTTIHMCILYIYRERDGDREASFWCKASLCYRICMFIYMYYIYIYMYIYIYTARVPSIFAEILPINTPQPGFFSTVFHLMYGISCYTEVSIRQLGNVNGLYSEGWLNECLNHVMRQVFMCWCVWQQLNVLVQLIFYWKTGASVTNAKSF